MTKGFAAFVGILLMALPIQVSAADPTPIPVDELRSLLIGSSYPLGANSWSRARGAIYFASKSKALIYWEGETEEATWKSGRASQVCTTSRIFGNDDCFDLFRLEDGQGFLHVYNGRSRKLPIAALIPGNEIPKLR